MALEWLSIHLDALPNPRYGYPRLMARQLGFRLAPALQRASIAIVPCASRSAAAIMNGPPVENRLRRKP